MPPSKLWGNSEISREAGTSTDGRETANRRGVLLSFEKGAPEWSLLGVPNAGKLPAVRWRMESLKHLGVVRLDGGDHLVDGAALSAPSVNPEGLVSVSSLTASPSGSHECGRTIVFPYREPASTYRAKSAPTDVASTGG